jgi:hypothetical protein
MCVISEGRGAAEVVVVVGGSIDMAFRAAKEEEDVYQKV